MTSKKNRIISKDVIKYETTAAKIFSWDQGSTPEVERGSTLTVEPDLIKKYFISATDTEPGKGTWMRMEEFLQHKSGTAVSHGCCPQCFEKHIEDD